jgi:hypothetical protein
MNWIMIGLKGDFFMTVMNLWGFHKEKKLNDVQKKTFIKELI